LAAAAALIGGCAPLPRADDGRVCSTDQAALASLIRTEYLFVESAQTSVRSAFLGFLAEDGIVLAPDPRPGLQVWHAAKESRDRLSWYPAVAELAGHGDLAYTAGPWTYTSAADGAISRGHFVTVWKRDEECRWRVAFDGGVAHAPAPHPEAPLREDAARYTTPAQPRTNPGLQASGAAIDAFDHEAERSGLGVAIRRFGRDDLEQYVGGQLPLEGAAAAGEYWAAHPVTGNWVEAGRQQSAGGDLVYSFGELGDLQGTRSAAYLQIWRYDSRAGDWRLRLFLFSLYPQPRKKP